MKQFYKSQEMFSKWRQENYDNISCCCMFQVSKNNILVEKWRLSDMVVLIEIYANGCGFMVYWPM